MALFPFCKTPSGPVRVTRLHLVLYCFLLSLIIYFLQGLKVSVGVDSPNPFFRALVPEKAQEMSDMTVVKTQVPQTPQETPWGAPLVWGDSSSSAWRRAKYAQKGIRTGLLTVVVGTYARFIRRFLSSAELHFLPGRMVTYYILTDNPRSMDPSIELGPERELKVVTVAELPGWDRLAYRRMSLLVETIRHPIGTNVEYLFCADIDLEFVAPVGEEILGDLVATLHPELYGMPRDAFPYEVEEVSSAFVDEDEGDYYYTSELYGGLVSEVYRLARACSMLILQDQAKGEMARGLEESYLNRYLIDHRPTCVLSPEYSCWDSALTADVPVQRVISLGRQCEATDVQMRERLGC
ncbi:LOW QUALITY PROTEIN: globoside alpha-1%2C3-N-acetylgalactosaminyltransferase 1-like [Xyrichtys novacula]|uniref:LOW QUALITY PROTEIN: globoside alpha-1,3-N-acetylgalactosaminyltransferase 1-like n=1 Tax=Xyrichtys novacula TaxID=13765 RepID=A0AAV1ERX9_XYRNO|nr:LOW QUALITY PROTEIN: globoside alpha-1%2C3-N-acetylgalactosaminyltransferase 1-like [Xyrichtys novacula]